MENYYDILNVHPVATQTEILEAYTQKRALLISDEANLTSELVNQLELLDEAYSILSDQNQRIAYDRRLAESTEQKSLILASAPQTITKPTERPIPIIQQVCPHCGALNPIQATMCFQCGQQVTRPCPNCGQPVILNQSICPRCNTFIPEYDQRRFAEALVMEEKVKEDRRETDMHAEALEETHRIHTFQGIIFWLFILGLLLGLIFLAGSAFNYFLLGN